MLDAHTGQTIVHPGVDAGAGRPGRIHRLILKLTAGSILVERDGRVLTIRRGRRKDTLVFEEHDNPYFNISRHEAELEQPEPAVC